MKKIIMVVLMMVVLGFNLFAEEEENNWTLAIDSITEEAQATSCWKGAIINEGSHTFGYSLLMYKDTLVMYDNGGFGISVYRNDEIVIGILQGETLVMRLPADIHKDSNGYYGVFAKLSSTSLNKLKGLKKRYNVIVHNATTDDMVGSYDEYFTFNDFGTAFKKYEKQIKPIK
jgi:hypothetical protein